jgi:hypothetical protein
MELAASGQSEVRVDVTGVDPRINLTRAEERLTGEYDRLFDISMHFVRGLVFTPSIIRDLGAHETSPHKNKCNINISCSMSRYSIPSLHSQLSIVISRNLPPHLQLLIGSSVIGPRLRFKDYLSRRFDSAIRFRSCLISPYWDGTFSRSRVS